MSCSGYAAGASCEAIEIQVLCLNGEGCNFTLTGSSLGHELRQMVLQGLPSKKGRTCVILYENSQLLLHQTLQEQGIVGKTATLRCTFVPTDLYAACCYTQGLPVPEGERALEGVTKIRCAANKVYLQHLPSTLETLHFCQSFNQTLEGVNLPSGLQSLTFGSRFNRTLEGVNLPSGLQTLTFGFEFNQTLEGVNLPSGLQSLTFGSRFNRTLEGVNLPSGLKNLAFGFEFNQTLEGVSLPSGLQSLSFGSRFNRTLKGVNLPSGLKNLAFGFEFNQTLEGVGLPSGLQSLSFGSRFNRTLKGVSLPSGLESLTLGDFDSGRGLVTWGDRFFRENLVGVSLPSGLQSLSCFEILVSILWFHCCGAQKVAWGSWGCRPDVRGFNLNSMRAKVCAGFIDDVLGDRPEVNKGSILSFDGLIWLRKHIRDHSSSFWLLLFLPNSALKVIQSLSWQEQLCHGHHERWLPVHKCMFALFRLRESYCISCATHFCSIKLRVSGYS